MSATILAGCASHLTNESRGRESQPSLPTATSPQTSTPEVSPPRVPDIGNPPKDIASIPDAVPQAVTRAALGNPAFYEVYGKRYFVLPTAVGFSERGVASWYGPGFHKEKTATGDAYNMYAMTAAHKTLPLPWYARVTNLNNGRSVVVYINDRGPFKEGRIVDLSYTAAAKLDMLRAGTAFVQLTVLTAGSPENLSTTASVNAAMNNELFVQAGAFKDVQNAQRLASKLRAAGYAQVTVMKDRLDEKLLHRVRIGPIASVAEFDKVLAQLKSQGIGDARLAAN